MSDRPCECGCGVVVTTSPYASKPKRFATKTCQRRVNPNAAHGHQTRGAELDAKIEAVRTRVYGSRTGRPSPDQVRARLAREVPEALHG